MLVDRNFLGGTRRIGSTRWPPSGGKREEEEECGSGLSSGQGDKRATIADLAYTLCSSGSVDKDTTYPTTCQVRIKYGMPLEAKFAWRAWWCDRSSDQAELGVTTLFTAYAGYRTPTNAYVCDSMKTRIDSTFNRLISKESNLLFPAGGLPSMLQGVVNIMG
jgi:hypothetical protein